MKRAFKKGQRNFLVVATPGSGKTRVAIDAAKQLLDAGEVVRVVVVCNSTQLRRQWAEAAAGVGLAFDPSWSNADGVEAPDLNGVTVTYQQVAAAPDLFRMQTQRDTLVIFDEHHHLGDRQQWGAAVEHAFEHARFRVGLSGTLFRSDNRRIPFVNYFQGTSKPDYLYTYRQALEDQVCRNIYFPTFDGTIEWLRGDSTEAQRCSLLEVVDRAVASERLRVALDPQGEWLRKVIAEADRQLSAIRAGGHADAGGLIVTMNHAHAIQVAALVREIVGETPVVILSSDPEASTLIRTFKHGTQRWLVAVRMVSEGTDIPRLRTGVYATNVLSELFFRQVVGRLLRWIDGLREQCASLYLPADETLRRFASAIMDEKEHQLFEVDYDEDEIQAAESNASANRVDGQAWSQHLIRSLSADPQNHDTIFQGASHPQIELTFAAEWCARRGIVGVPFVYVAAILREGAAQAGGFPLFAADSVPHVARAVPESSADRDIARLRERTNAISETLADYLGATVEEIHQDWIDIGGLPVGEATTQDLERKLAWLQHRLSDEISARGFMVGDGRYSRDELVAGINDRTLS